MSRLRLVSLARCVAAFALSYLSLGPCVGLASAQDFSPLSAFARLSSAELSDVQLKLTDLVIQDHPGPTLLLVAAGATPDIRRFRPYRRPEFVYLADDVQSLSYASSNPEVLPVTREELRAMIERLSALPGVADGGVDSAAWLSLSLVLAHGKRTLGFESVLNQASAVAAVGALRSGIRGSRTAEARLADYACGFDLVQGPLPVETTASMDVKWSDVHPDSDASGDVFLGTYTITNRGATVNAPVRLVIPITDTRVQVLQPSGHTCRLRPLYSAYFELPVGSAFAPGESVSVRVRIDNPNRRRLGLTWTLSTGEVFAPRLFTGPGDL